MSRLITDQSADLFKHMPAGPGTGPRHHLSTPEDILAAYFARGSFRNPTPVEYAFNTFFVLAAAFHVSMSQGGCVSFIDAFARTSDN